MPGPAGVDVLVHSILGTMSAASLRRRDCDIKWPSGAYNTVAQAIVAEAA